jgi:hypothetical protein
MSMRLLKRLAKSFGVSSNTRKGTVLLVYEVVEASTKQRPTETVIKLDPELDPLPQPQPEPGDSVPRAEASTTPGCAKSSVRSSRCPNPANLKPQLQSSDQYVTPLVTETMQTYVQHSEISGHTAQI